MQPELITSLILIGSIAFCSVEQELKAITERTKNTICFTISIAYFELNELILTTYKCR